MDRSPLNRCLNLQTLDPERTAHMPDRKPMSIKLQRLLSSRVAYALDCVANSSTSSVRGHVLDALRECEEGERKHRAMGARWTNGSASYRIPVATSAVLMMGRSFFCEAEERAAGSVAELHDYRSDHLHMILAYAGLTSYERRVGDDQPLKRILERLEAPTEDLRKALRAHGLYSVLHALRMWDYSVDCAVRS